MDYTAQDMNKSIIKDIDIYHEEQFRIPSRTEYDLGLWVDRIGKNTTSKKPGQLRVLGQYAHIYIIHGSGEYLSKDAGRYQVSEGDCMIQFPDDPCLYYPHTQWTTCWVTWNGPEARKYEELDYISRKRAVFPDSSAAAFHAHTALTNIVRREDREAVLLRKNTLLGMILKAYSASSNLIQASPQKQAIQKAVDYLYQYYDKQISIAELAGELNFSPSHFRRLFRQYTGRSPTVFIRSLRMAEAKRLLLAGDTIKHVAGEVGYQDVFHFMRTFKQAVGKPPGEFQHSSTGQFYY